MVDGEITIEGRVLKPVKNATFEHDIYAMQVVSRSGLQQLHPIDGEDDDSFVSRLAVKAWESGAAIDLMAALLMPVEMEPAAWTPAGAQQLADFFRKVTDPESKRLLRMRIGAILFGFFVNALSFSKTSGKSLTPSQVGQGAAGGTEGAYFTAIGA